LQLWRAEVIAPQFRGSAGSNRHARTAAGSAAPKQVTQPQRESPTKTPKPSAIEEERNSESPTPEPASASSRDIAEEPTETVAKLPAGAVVHGESPNKSCPMSSRAQEIRFEDGEVRVNVDVDRSGNVEGADLESPGPSKYFARAALQAAQTMEIQAGKYRRAKAC